jgi:wobble nucleotide-excising tRNase
MFIKEEENEFDSLYLPMITCLNSNKQKISDKKQFPSHSITLDSSVNLIKKLNDFLITINDQISQYNKKIDNKIKTKDEIKKKFWNLMRFNYSQIIEVYQLENKQKEDQKNEISKRVLEIEKKIELEKNNIKEQQKKTVNIKEAIDNINNELINLGLDSFSIKKHSNNLYKIVRDGEDKNAFFSLSEGEKTVISFLYFVELCKGKQNEEDVNNEKIIIIDDPISSLSHIFIFNIAELIKTNFLKKNTSKFLY